MTLRRWRRWSNAASGSPAGAALGALLIVAVPSIPLPATASDDPRVPAGRDPGGVPVAIIGPGIDYRLPEVAQRLARDGEGELIGWDFVDNDLRPFEPSAICTPAPCGPDAPSRSLPPRRLLAEAGMSRLIVLRAADGARGALAAAIAFTSRSPARIVPTLASGPEGRGPDWTLLIEAARRFSNLLLVVPAYGPAIEVPGFEKVAIGNLLIVAPSTPTGEPLPARADPQPPFADIAVAIEAGAGETARGARELAEDAAARVAAIAARLSATEPLLDAHGLKREILKLAKPMAPHHDGRVRSGWIAEPSRHFRLE